MKTVRKLSLSATFLISSSTMSTTPLLAQAEPTQSLYHYESLQIMLDTQEKDTWSYSGSTGPEFWADLDEEFKACTHGEEQSPIGLHREKLLEEDKWSIDLDYNETEFSIENNGHTIQANVDDHTSNKLTLNGTVYKLVQFHFHSPSEHTLNNDYYELEVHFVHQDKNNNLAVLGVLIEEGDTNETLANMWDVMPDEKGEAEETISLHPSGIVPTDLSTFQYDGSLTTPPCSEGVRWSVSNASITMSAEQIQAFQDLYPNNYRPIQEIGNREIGYHY
ncbi:carbonic anhydrase [Alkalicoccobacillus porphyridii]|nr:carbonic anhydrase family protein [Alkalicoccobacillus porphyridii]